MQTVVSRERAHMPRSARGQPEAAFRRAGIRRLACRVVTDLTQGDCSGSNQTRMEPPFGAAPSAWRGCA
jgi:hypothetical protein